MHLIYRWRKLSGISVLFYLKGINRSQLPLMYVLKGQIKFFVDKICSYNYFSATKWSSTEAHIPVFKYYFTWMDYPSQLPPMAVL